MISPISVRWKGFRPLTEINFNKNRCGIGARKKPSPSPHGDKFQRVTHYDIDASKMSPSPHGDKFQPKPQGSITKLLSFRPLTGINFNMDKMNYSEKTKFPSPHGDKFQLFGLISLFVVLMFPSPHGDKFQHDNEAI